VKGMKLRELPEKGFELAQYIEHLCHILNICASLGGSRRMVAMAEKIPSWRGART